LSSLASIVIPCYNQAKYLEETVQSALASTHSMLEVIIVNDGSTDESEEVAEKLTQKFTNVTLLNQKNGGVAQARNTGIEFARGKYILPLDGDDLISPNYLKAAIEVLEQSSEAKVVYSKGVKFDQKDTYSWKLKPFSRYQLARDNMIFVSGVFRKSDWKACGGFSEDMKFGREDWEFWIKMLKSGGEVVQLPFVGFFYRLTPGSKRKKTGTSKRKQERIAYLNEKHADFFLEQLNGPLRIQRTWSKPYNSLLKLLGKL